MNRNIRERTNLLYLCVQPVLLSCVNRREFFRLNAYLSVCVALACELFSFIYDRRSYVCMFVIAFRLKPLQFYLPRYSSPSIKDPVSLSRAFTENKLKTSASFANTNAGDSSGFSLLKKSYSSHDATELNHSHSNVSETDAAAPSRQSIGSHSIPTPSVDDMEPQCISFIGK